MYIYRLKKLFASTYQMVLSNLKINFTSALLASLKIMILLTI